MLTAPGRCISQPSADAVARPTLSHPSMARHGRPRHPPLQPSDVSSGCHRQGHVSREAACRSYALWRTGEQARHADRSVAAAGVNSASAALYNVAHPTEADVRPDEAHRGSRGRSPKARRRPAGAPEREGSERDVSHRERGAEGSHLPPLVAELRLVQQMASRPPAFALGGLRGSGSGSALSSSGSGSSLETDSKPQKRLQAKLQVRAFASRPRLSQIEAPWNARALQYQKPTCCRSCRACPVRRPDGAGWVCLWQELGDRDALEEGPLLDGAVFHNLVRQCRLDPRWHSQVRGRRAMPCFQAAPSRHAAHSAVDWQGRWAAMWGKGHAMLPTMQAVQTAVIKGRAPGLGCPDA